MIFYPWLLILITNLSIYLWWFVYISYSSATFMCCQFYHRWWQVVGCVDVNMYTWLMLLCPNNKKVSLVSCLPVLIFSLWMFLDYVFVCCIVVFLHVFYAIALSHNCFTVFNTHVYCACICHYVLSFHFYLTRMFMFRQSTNSIHLSSVFLLMQGGYSHHYYIVQVIY